MNEGENQQKSRWFKLTPEFMIPVVLWGLLALLPSCAFKTVLVSVVAFGASVFYTVCVLIFLMAIYLIDAFPSLDNLVRISNWLGSTERFIWSTAAFMIAWHVLLTTAPYFIPVYFLMLGTFHLLLPLYILVGLKRTSR